MGDRRRIECVRFQRIGAGLEQEHLHRPESISPASHTSER